MSKHFDILVVGGGPAGYSAAIHAARAVRAHGATVGLVESSRLGGTCLNRGCIPTKTLIETAHLLDRFETAAQRGIEFSGTASIDLVKAYRYKDRIVKRLGAGIGVLLRDNGVSQIDGTATIRRSDKEETPFHVTVSGKDGNAGADTAPLLARTVILATGSVPSTVPIPGLDAVADRVLSSDDILDVDTPPPTIPGQLAILGGGVIGIEAARIFRAFGSRVHLVEALPRLVPMLDVEVSEALKKAVLARDIAVTVGRRLERVEPAGDGMTLLLDDGQRIAATHLLVAVGRSPKTDMLSDELLRELRPDHDGARGFLPVDPEMRTKVPGLYAPGDVNGKCMLAHAALEMGRLAAEAAVDRLFPANNQLEEINETELEEYRRRIMEKSDNSLLPDRTMEFFPFYVPGCIYGEPEVGYFGWTEEQAREKLGDRIQVGRFPFAANGRAATSGCRDGFVKVIRHKNDQRIVGVHIVGPCASELINEVSAVVASGGNVEQWAESVHAHPTYGEALVEAAADSLGLALHLPPHSV